MMAITLLSGSILPTDRATNDRMEVTLSESGSRTCSFSSFCLLVQEIKKEEDNKIANAFMSKKKKEGKISPTI